MAVKIVVQKTSRKYTGLEADIKPVLGLDDVGAVFYETDTDYKFEWTGSTWRILAEVDAINHSLVIIESEHHRIHEGVGFIHSHKHIDILADSSLDILLTTDATTYPHLKHLLVTSTGGPFDTILYKDSITSDPGSALTTTNLNLNSTNTSGITVTEGPTITEIGTEIGFDLLPTSSLGAQTSGGALSDSITEFILKPNSKYIWRILNNDTVTLDIGVNIFWYE